MFIYQTSLRDQYYEKAVDLYYREGLSVRRIAKIIPASKTTVMRWIANFAEDNPHKAPIMKKRSIKPASQIEQEPRTDLPEDVKALQEEVLRLKKELKQEKMRADAYDMMIDLAEDAFILDGKLNHKWALNTVKKWGTLRAHMLKFNRDITLDDFDKETLDAYVRFGATEIHMLDVSIRKELSLLRWYLGWCVDKGYTTNQTFSKYRARLKDTKKPVIFLEKDELLKLYSLKIPKNGTEVVLHDMDGEEYRKVVTEKASMDKVRDLFCFCCFTSLRYSDLAQLQRTNIQDGYIQLTTIKTDDTVNVPLNEQAQAILNKYAAFDFDGLALPVISNQKMNQYLKDICELCEFITPVTIAQYIDGKRKDICQPKWKLMATHAARRTFICTALAAGIPPQVIMKMTGHSDYKAMKPYIEVAERTKDDAMVKFANFLK